MCANSECPENFSVKYKYDDIYCKKCGEKLVYVCKQCKQTILENGKTLVCEECLNKREETKQKATPKVLEIGKKVIIKK